MLEPTVQNEINRQLLVKCLRFTRGIILERIENARTHNLANPYSPRVDYRQEIEMRTVCERAIEAVENHLPISPDDCDLLAEYVQQVGIADKEIEL